MNSNALLALATRAILQTPGIWAQVTAVAEALLRRNRLTWDEVRAVMNNSGPQDPCSGERGAVAYRLCVADGRAWITEAT